METRKVAAKVELRAALVDFVELVAKAVLSGVGVAFAMAVAILALSGGAHAQPVTPNDARTGTLLFRSGDTGSYLAAPKVSTEVGITVHGMVARTSVTQTFDNPATETVEGIYVFPLPEGAAIDRLQLRVGDRLIEGQVQEKGEARRTYERAKGEGRKASLLEQQRPNLFTNAVAPIGAGERVVVRIEYQQSLAYRDGRYGLRFPMAITPRYVPAHDALPEEPKDTEAIATASEALLMPPQEGAAAGLVNPVDIAVSIDAGMALADVTSSDHEVQVVTSEGGATVSLVREQEDMDRDFDLSWRVAGAAPQAAIFTEHGNGATYALLMVVPPAATAQQKAAAPLPRETILVIDTSGSMAGTSITQARLAVGQALAALTPNDRFNVIEFNSVTHALYPEPQAATAGRMAEAQAWVARLQARGGTEMAPALELALGTAETPGYMRQVVFMTDGAVGNEDQLFALIAKKVGNARLFTVGIGSAPNSHFLAKSAQHGRGTFTYIGDVREVQEKMATLFAKIASPVLRDVAIRWPDGSAVETFPPRVPDLWPGEPLLVAASISSAGPVVVTGMRGNEPWSVALAPPADDAAGVGALWAKAKIASLMDGLALGDDAARVRGDVIKVALEHHLASAYTSLVAVDVTPTVAPGTVAKLAMVHGALPAGSMVGTLPQTDTPARLQALLGFAALLIASFLAVASRRRAGFA